MSSLGAYRGQDASRERGVSPTGSSASGLSSPPRSSPEPSSPSAQLNSSHMSITVNPPLATTTAAEKPARKKPGRKPKNNPVDSSATNTDAPKQRRPRKPKDPNAPQRKPRKSKDASLANAASANLSDTNSNMGQAPLRNMIESASAYLIPAPPPPQPTTTSGTTPASQKGNDEVIQRDHSIKSFFSSGPAPPAPPPQSKPQSQAQPMPQPVRTSGQNYDPIRSNFDPVRETVVNHISYNNHSQGSPINSNSLNHRASASPSISSLVDPPNQALTSPSVATQSFFNQQQQQQQQARLHREEISSSVPPSPSANRPAPSDISEPSNTQNPPAAAQTAPTAPAVPAAMKHVESLPPSSANAVAKKATSVTASSSAAASPKPPKPKDSANSNGKEIFPAPPPLPGSGIMGGTDGTEFRAPTIILSIPMNGEGNKYVNFSRMAEERYGWDALHPRLAAQRDRLARVAAAGAALERNGASKESGDEMSLDSDAEEGSNVEMGGMSDGRTGTEGGAKAAPRKRKMKEDEYDKDDGFVDDTEMLWEEQAVAANDGFFVYSGPLVPEGEKPHLESRAEGPPKRGRGRGSRGGRLSGATRGAITAAEKLRNGIPLTGPGSRGGSTTRKPRITKADRARMEQEKLDREKMGTMASMPSNYGGGMSQLASASQMGTTPMVFNS